MSVDIRLGDCLDLLADVPAGSIDLVLCDPPYGTTANKWDAVIPFAPMWEALLRVGKPSAAFVFTASQPFSSALVMSRPDLFRHEWVWNKCQGSNFLNTKREPMKEHEAVLVFSRGRWTYNKQMQPRNKRGQDEVGRKKLRGAASTNYGDFKGGRVERPELRVPSSVQRFSNERGLHPTQKPVALMDYLVRTYSNPGDTVLDFTMGSGTTGVACQNLGRRFVGMERDPQHFATAQRRLMGNAPLFAEAAE